MFALRICFILLFAILDVLQAGTLRSVVIYGYQRVDRKTIDDIIAVEPRSMVDTKLVADVDARLNSSGLFKKVKVQSVKNPDGSSDLRIYVVEKQLWFAFPIVQAWSGRYAFGGAFGESNLFYPSTRTIFGGQWGTRTSRVFAAADIKNIRDTNIAARAFGSGKFDDVPIYRDETILEYVHINEGGFAMIPGYQWTNEIRTSLGIEYRYFDYGPATTIAEANSSGQDIAMQFEFLFDSLKRKDGFVNGNLLRTHFTFAQPQFGTKYSYHIEELTWLHARMLLKHFNYTFFTRGAIGHDLPFHRQFTLGGTSLRGYADRQFRGDTLVSVKQDLLYKLFSNSRFSTFLGAFHDLGFLYTDQIGSSWEDVHNDVGGGLRLSLADIVAPVMGVDFGYGLEDQSYQIIFELGLVSF